MLIISKFKDYYDKVSFIYGIDKKLVFNRDANLPSNFILHISDEKVIRPIGHIRDSNKLEMQTLIDRGLNSISLLVVCGKIFYLGHFQKNQELIQYQYIGRKDTRKIKNVAKENPTFFYHFELINEDIIHSSCRNSFFFSKNEKDDLMNKRYIIELTKKVKSPVFIIEDVEVRHRQNLDDYCFSINDKVPCLSLIKCFAKKYNENQLYQDLCYYLGNVINESPDVQPAGKPEQTNIEKVVSHGFDKKQSFRHRKILTEKPGKMFL